MLPMRTLTRHLLTRMLAMLVVALLMLSGLLWVLQTLRIGHQLLAGGPRWLLPGLLLYSLPTLLVLVMPVALAVAILYSLDQLEASGELEAMRTVGASPLQLAQPGVLLCLSAALVVLGATQLEPRALSRLQRTVRDAAAHTLAAEIRPGRFHPMPDGAVLYARSRGRDGQLQGLFIARDRQLLTARRGSLQVLGSHHMTLQLGLHLSRGEVLLTDDEGRLSQIRFGELEQRLELGPILAPLMRLVARQGSPLLAMVSVLALGLLALAVELGPGRRRRAIVGVGLVPLYLVAAWVLTQRTGNLGPLLLAALAGGASLVWLVRAGGPGRERGK